MANKNIWTSIRQWAERKERSALTKRYGGTQVCPWCKQCAQRQDGWKFACHSEEPRCDILHCGVCGGTSLWFFEMGMTYVCMHKAPLPMLSSAFQEGK